MKQKFFLIPQTKDYSVSKMILNQQLEHPILLLVIFKNLPSKEHIWLSCILVSVAKGGQRSHFTIHFLQHP